MLSVVVRQKFSVRMSRRTLVANDSLQNGRILDGAGEEQVNGVFILL
jgi:hypothetical protein